MRSWRDCCVSDTWGQLKRHVVPSCTHHVWTWDSESCYVAQKVAVLLGMKMHIATQLCTIQVASTYQDLICGFSFPCQRDQDTLWEWGTMVWNSMDMSHVYAHVNWNYNATSDVKMQVLKYLTQICKLLNIYFICFHLMEYTFLQKFSVLSYFQLSIAILDMYGMLLSIHWAMFVRPNQNVYFKTSNIKQKWNIWKY